MTPPFSSWFTGELARTAIRSRRACRAFGELLRQGAALWRKPAPGSGLLCRRLDRAPASPPPPQLQGKELSYNNINDTDAAYELVAEFDPKPARPAPSSSMPIPAAWPWEQA